MSLCEKNLPKYSPTHFCQNWFNTFTSEKAATKLGYFFNVPKKHARPKQAPVGEKIINLVTL
jgi:hypothetical protein